MCESWSRNWALTLTPTPVELVSVVIVIGATIYGYVYTTYFCKDICANSSFAAAADIAPRYNKLFSFFLWKKRDTMREKPFFLKEWSWTWEIPIEKCPSSSLQHEANYTRYNSFIKLIFLLVLEGLFPWGRECKWKVIVSSINAVFCKWRLLFSDFHAPSVFFWSEQR